MAFIEKLLPVTVKRVPFVWAGITVVFLFSVVAKGYYVQHASRKAAQRAPGKKVVIIGEGGSATTIDPQR